MTWQRLLADAILVIHFAFVAFVIGGFAVTWLGYFCRWNWVRSVRFRISHLLAMAFVLFESLIGMVCPLTEWEHRLRQSAGGTTHQESFIQHWLGRLLFYEVSERTLTVVYAGFFLLLLATFYFVPPRRRGQTIDVPTGSDSF